MYCTCAETAISEVPERVLTSPIVIRLTDPDFLKVAIMMMIVLLNFRHRPQFVMHRNCQLLGRRTIVGNSFDL